MFWLLAVVVAGRLDCLNSHSAIIASNPLRVRIFRSLEKPCILLTLLAPASGPGPLGAPRQKPR